MWEQVKISQQNGQKKKILRFTPSSEIISRNKHFYFILKRVNLKSFKVSDIKFALFQESKKGFCRILKVEPYLIDDLLTIKVNGENFLISTEKSTFYTFFEENIQGNQVVNIGATQKYVLEKKDSPLSVNQKIHQNY